MTNKVRFEKIYLDYYPMLLVYGKTITKDIPLIEDTIQELFLSFWQKEEDLDAKESLENYLIVSLRNNLIRKRKKTDFRELNFDVKDEIGLEQDPRALKIQDLIKQLPNHQKEILFLRFYKNKSYSEISETLDISYQVARNFSHRAIKFIKKNMKKLPSVLMF